MLNKNALKTVFSYSKFAEICRNFQTFYLTNVDYYLINLVFIIVQKENLSCISEAEVDDILSGCSVILKCLAVRTRDVLIEKVSDSDEELFLELSKTILKEITYIFAIVENVLPKENLSKMLYIAVGTILEAMSELLKMLVGGTLLDTIGNKLVAKTVSRKVIYMKRTCLEMNLKLNVLCIKLFKNERIWNSFKGKTTEMSLVKEITRELGRNAGFYYDMGDVKKSVEKVDR